MRILHIATGFQLSYPGGITNYVRTLAKSQIEAGNEVHVLARPETATGNPVAGSSLHPYVPSEVVPFSLRNCASDSSEVSIVDLIRREKYDLIHFHMALDLSLGCLRSFSSLRVPYVVSLHDYFYICPRITMIDSRYRVCRKVEIEKCKSCIGKLDQINFLRRASNKVKTPLPRIASSAAEERMDSMQRFLAGAARLLAVSTRTAEIYQHAVPSARIVVEQIGSESVAGAVDKIPSAKIRVVALSTLSRHKGADLLQMFLRRVNRPDMEFHFYGRAVEGYGKKLSRYGLNCHGPYRPSDIAGIMSQSDIGLVLSIWEDNGPQVAMEFINHRIPVLGTTRGGIPDIVLPECGHLFDPDRADEVEKAVQWLQTISLEEIARISKGIRKLRTPEEHALRVSALYEQILREEAGQLLED